MKEKIIDLIVDVENGIISRLKCANIIEHLVNQEVERRIKERMPSEDNGRDRIPYPDKPTELKHYQNIGFIRGWRAAIKECRSRLTPQVTPQEQKEGGEG